MAYTKMLIFPLNESTYTFIRDKAYEDKISKAEVVRRAIRHYYDLDYVLSQEEKYKRFKKP